MGKKRPTVLSTGLQCRSLGGPTWSCVVVFREAGIKIAKVCSGPTIRDKDQYATPPYGNRHSCLHWWRQDQQWTSSQGVLAKLSYTGQLELQAGLRHTAVSEQHSLQ